MEEGGGRTFVLMTEGFASALGDLPDALLTKILLFAGLVGATRTCQCSKALHELDSSDAYWTELFQSRWSSVSRAAVKATHLGTFRALCRALLALDNVPGLYMTLTDFPWGMLIAVRLDEASGDVVGETVPVDVRAGTAAVGSPVVLFRVPIATAADEIHGGFEARALGRRARLLHSHARSRAQRAEVRARLPVHPPNDVEKLRPWLADVRTVSSLFSYVWPPMQTIRVHQADTLLLEIARDHDGALTQPTPLRDYRGPPRSVRWMLAALEQQTALMGESRPFFCLARVAAPEARWPAWPEDVQHLLHAHGPHALPSLGLYAADYGPSYGPRRTEIVQLRVLRLPACRDHVTVAEMPFLGADAQFEEGAVYLVAVKVCGDCHVPQGATTFAVKLIDRLGKHAQPLRSTAEEGRTAAYWAGLGCLAFPGFHNHSFTPGFLHVARGGEFDFVWAGESRHSYYKLALDDSMLRCAAEETDGDRAPASDQAELSRPSHHEAASILLAVGGHPADLAQ